MKLSEFTRRARASRLEKKAKLEAAFERARRDLNLPEANAGPIIVPPRTYIRSELSRWGGAQSPRAKERDFPQAAE
ncbi:MAG: hypothetical protein ABWZ19_01655 [Hyphomicrobium sp.]